MSDLQSLPDLLIKDSAGNVYYAPGSVVKKLDLAPDHPLHDAFDKKRPGNYHAHGLMGHFEKSDFVLRDGQRARVRGGAKGIVG